MIKPNLNITYGVYSSIARPYICVAEYINITKEMIMKTIKFTKKQIEILRHSVGEYEQFLCMCDDPQIKEHQEMNGKNLFDNLKRIQKKLYG